jgi:hypothetical protein
MNSIYASASHVLALDNQLSSLKFSETSVERLVAYIFFSDWNQRLWTYHEAKLSDSLQFALGDVAIGAGELVSLGYKSVRTRALSLLILHIDGLRASSENQDKSLQNIMRCLEGRQSTEPEDESIVVANIMGLESESIQMATGEDRYRQFWRVLRQVPSSIIFSGNSNRCVAPGFRWAPRSFMAQRFESCSITSVQKQLSTVHPFGLVGTYTVLRVGKISVQPRNAEIVSEKQRLQFPCGNIVEVTLPTRSVELVYDTILLPFKPNSNDFAVQAAVASIVSNPTEIDWLLCFLYRSIATAEFVGIVTGAVDIEVQAELVLKDKEIVVI